MKTINWPHRIISAHWKPDIFSKKCKTNASGYPDLKHDFIINKNSDEMLEAWLQ